MILVSDDACVLETDDVLVVVLGLDADEEAQVAGAASAQCVVAPEGLARGYRPLTRSLRLGPNTQTLPCAVRRSRDNREDRSHLTLRIWGREHWWRSWSGLLVGSTCAVSALHCRCGPRPHHVRFHGAGPPPPTDPRSRFRWN